MSLYFEQFTFAQFLDRMNRPGKECHQWSGTIGGDWHGTNTFEEARDLLERGWPEGAMKLQRAAMTATPTGDAFGFTPQFSTVGDEVSVDRYLEGEPDHMIEWNLSRIKAPGRIATIMLNASASSGMTSAAYLARGLMALTLIEAFESAGVRCEVAIVQSLKKYGNILVQKVTIKSPDQPLDVDRLAFLLMHISTYRRLLFRLDEQLPEKQFEIFSNGGHPENIPASLVPENAITVPELLLGASDIQTWVQSTLARYLEPTAQAA